MNHSHQRLGQLTDWLMGSQFNLFLFVHFQMKNNVLQIQNEHKPRAKPLNDVAGVFFCVSRLSWIQLTLKPQELLTCDWRYKKKRKENINKHLFLFCSCNNMNEKLALTNVA